MESDNEDNHDDDENDVNLQSASHITCQISKNVHQNDHLIFDSTYII